MKYDVVIIGAGPAGLSCAIEAHNAGLVCAVLDKGSVVDSIRRFPSNLIWFSTPELLEIGGLPFVISTVRPTRDDAINYYQRVVRHFGLEVHQFEAVKSLTRTEGGFSVLSGRGKTYPARSVVVATGYYDHPNRLGIEGESLPKVMHNYNEPYRYFDSDVAVVGGRNSAVEASLDLYRHGARVTLIHRGEKLSEGVKYWILPDIENRIRSGEVTALLRTVVREIRQESIRIEGPDGVREIPNDFVFILIGFVPDVADLRSFGVEIDGETLAPRHDPATFETSVPGLYVAGSIVAGRNNNKVFVENGRLHGKAIVASILSKRTG